MLKIGGSGAFDGQWAHASCATWIPLVQIKGDGGDAPVTGVDRVDQRRFKVTCALCKLKQGACLQCIDKKCRVSAHVTCVLATKDDPVEFKLSLKKTEKKDRRTCFCSLHSQKA